MVAVPFENLFLVETKGVDIDARVRLPDIAAGRFVLGLTGSYVISYKQPLAPEEPLTEFAGTYDLPRFKGVGTVNWDRGPLSTTLAVNYVHSFAQSSVGAGRRGSQIKAWTTFDLQAAWSGLRNTKITFG